ncbi:hypothetical protein [Burkholderia ubonensis]|uniref:hypothetical protein n=1 Tax=Burkholderia ubonensis TaxID=101571 RepID=UPI0007561208|nr:hypothetical protein [Burkholderia ubonensis]KVW63480.1 hypothetical protein WK99_13105 [Burkholderia ubonensis]
MNAQNEKCPAPEQASEAVPQRPKTENPTAEAIFEQAAGAGNLISSKFGFGDGNNRADALTDDQRQALGEAISEYFGKLDSDEGVRAPEGRILRTFDYCDSRNIDDLIDRAIVPALTVSPVEQPAGANERAECIAWANANGFTKYHESMCAAWEERARRAAASPAAEAVAIPVEWDQDAAIEALSDFPKGSIRYEFLEEVGFDPTSGPIYVLTVQGRAMLDQLKSAYFAAPQPTAQTTTDEANGMTLDRRDLFDFARGAIKSALVDYKAGEGMTETWYWQEATNRAEALLEALDTKSPHIEAARAGESR